MVEMINILITIFMAIILLGITILILVFLGWLGIYIIFMIKDDIKKRRRNNNFYEKK